MHSISCNNNNREELRAYIQDNEKVDVYMYNKKETKGYASIK